MKSYAEIKKQLNNIVNKMTMEELETLLGKAKEIKHLRQFIEYLKGE